MINDLFEVNSIIKDIHQLGCKVVLDDFGSKYSSLAYLLELSVDVVKLDKRYSINKDNFEKNKVIIRSMLDLSNTIGFQLIAEGIEEENTLKCLLECGVSFGQGYELSYPLTINALNDLLNHRPHLNVSNKI